MNHRAADADRRWPSWAEIETMESTEAYDLYYGLEAPANPEQLAIIRALGDQAWKMRQEEDAGKPKPSYLPMPERIETPAPAPLPAFKRKPKPAPKEEVRGGSQFFLSALKP